MSGNNPSALHRRSSTIFYTSVFQLPPSSLPHLLFLLSWTPMETVASWHGEVNYKRYQSLGVVGWLVGLGSTDSQLPLRADPRARAIPSFLTLLASLPPSLLVSPLTPPLSFLLRLSRFDSLRLTLSILFTSTVLASRLRRSFVLTSHQ